MEEKGFFAIFGMEQVFEDVQMQEQEEDEEAVEEMQHVFVMSAF